MRSHAQDADLEIVRQNIDILLLNMINFLDAKKLEMGQFKYDHDHMIDLTRLISTKIVLFQAVADKKGITISADIASDIFVKADPWAIDRILNNLLDNAIKYGRTKGTILVNVKKSGEAVLIEVADDGPGIAPDKINHIFEPYYQLSHEKSGSQGIGMGLYIVRKIIDSLEGELRVDSKEGEGTTFTIVLRQCLPDAGVRGSEVDFVVSAVPDTLQAATVEGKEVYSADKYSILVVDDNAAIRWFLQASLKEKYNVFSTGSAREALLKIETFPELAVIISDVMMDDLDGHAFLDVLSRDERYGNIPFIFLTAKHDENDKLAGLAQGAIDYIEKPFSIHELSNKIGTLISFRKKQSETEASRLKNDIVSVLFGKDRPVQDQEYDSIKNMCIKYKLTFREEEILTLMLRKVPQKEIASRFNIVLRTVEFHIKNIYKKLCVKDRHELYALFNKKDGLK
jgi:DNA-binding NarL/FixJ family response regulator/anti-sigma regulatory factor (Ser/Thr protein kinase)